MPSTPTVGPTVADVARYLQIMGWTTEGADGLTVFYPREENDLQIVLPVQPDNTRNVDTYIADAIRVIAYAEGRTVHEVSANLTGTGADRIAVRLLPETPSGTAPLAAAREAITALRDLVVGAASALRNDSLTLPSRATIEIDDYANRTQFSTRSGSFIVDLTLPLTLQTTPAAPADPTTERPDDEGGLFTTAEVDTTPQRDLNPYGRAVSRRIRQTVNRALDAANQVSNGNLTLSAFTEPGRGLGNATELDAIANLGGGLGTPFQIRFAESELAPGAQPVAVLTATPVQQQVLSAAATLIREKQTIENHTLVGYIIRLYKKRPNPHAPGDVTVRAVIEELGDTVNCWLHLTGEDYERALQAHSDGLEVHATGTLEYVRDRWRLRDVTNFDAPTEPRPPAAQQ